MAGQIRDLARRSLHRNFASIDPGQARVVLFEAAAGLFPTYARELSLAPSRR